MMIARKKVKELSEIEILKTRLWDTEGSQRKTNTKGQMWENIFNTTL